MQAAEQDEALGVSAPRDHFGQSVRTLVRQEQGSRPSDSSPGGADSSGASGSLESNRLSDLGARAIGRTVQLAAQLPDETLE